MNLQFTGVYRLNGNRKAIDAKVKELQETKPLAIYTHVAPTDVLVVTGKDSETFLLNKLYIHLDSK